MVGWEHGWFGGWMWLWPILGLAIVALVVWLMVSGAAKGGSGQGRDAESILKERYARGEIDEEEYNRRLAGLRR